MELGASGAPFFEGAEGRLEKKIEGAEGRLGKILPLFFKSHIFLGGMAQKWHDIFPNFGGVAFGLQGYIYMYMCEYKYEYSVYNII
jgi:hypothetical protein